MKMAEIVGTTWVFKRKRRSDGTIMKNKARLVVRGAQQKVVGRTINETCTCSQMVKNLIVIDSSCHTKPLHYTNRLQK
jgi:hypothetical protein